MVSLHLSSILLETLLGLDVLVRTSLDNLRSLALLGRGLLLLVTLAVSSSSLLAALLGSGLCLGRGDSGVYSVSEMRSAQFRL
jgi:hypothetical protein